MALIWGIITVLGLFSICEKQRLNDSIVYNKKELIKGGRF